MEGSIEERREIDGAGINTQNLTKPPHPISLDIITDGQQMVFLRRRQEHNSRPVLRTSFHRALGGAKFSTAS